VSLRSLLGGIADSAPPVPYISKWRNSLISLGYGAGASRDRAGQMALYSEIGTLYGVVSKLASMTSRVEWKLWQKAASGLKEDRTEVTRHAAKMVWDRPNPFMPRQEFVEVGQQHVDLAGEWYWVIITSRLTGGTPIELWPVRPDRMTPVESNTQFIAGYIYTSPDGEKVPLRREDVLMIRVPAPLDVYRGLSPVTALESDLGQSQMQTAWASAFFRNAAQPGGIIEVDKQLRDEEFQEMVTRWQQQHQGVANAGRVAILEQAKFTPLSYSQKDMQFVESRGLTKQAVLDAYGFPKFGLGDVDDVNRATANASLALMAETLTVPRLDRIKGALNNDFLHLFGATARNLEFDYENPVPPDIETENATLTAKTAAWKTLVDAGADPDEAADVVGLPRMKVEKPEPKIVQVPAGGVPDDGTAGA
jgi:HK97 family phage portal protein